MTTPNKDEVKGKWEQAKGWAKDKAGEVTDNPKLEAEGETQHALGKAQETWGKFKREVGDAITDAGKKIGK
jgi:uncharacterized protein YjbJ (UPF0337 family)